MNTKTGFWSAFGALAGGLAGALAGRYVAHARPRARYERGYAEQPTGTEIEDAMVIGGSAGAMLGAFIGGSAAGEEETPQLSQ